MHAAEAFAFQGPFPLISRSQPVPVTNWPSFFDFWNVSLLWGWLPFIRCEIDRDVVSPISILYKAISLSHRKLVAFLFLVMDDIGAASSSLLSLLHQLIVASIIVDK